MYKSPIDICALLLYITQVLGMSLGRFCQLTSGDKMRTHAKKSPKDLLKQIKAMVAAWISTQDGLTHETVRLGANVVVTVKKNSAKKLPLSNDEKWAIRKFVEMLIGTLKCCAKNSRQGFGISHRNSSGDLVARPQQ